MEKMLHTTMHLSMNRQFFVYCFEALRGYCLLFFDAFEEISNDRSFGRFYESFVSSAYMLWVVKFCEMNCDNYKVYIIAKIYEATKSRSSEIAFVRYRYRRYKNRVQVYLITVRRPLNSMNSIHKQATRDSSSQRITKKKKHKNNPSRDNFGVIKTKKIYRRHARFKIKKIKKFLHIKKSLQRREELEKMSTQDSRRRRRCHLGDTLYIACRCVTMILRARTSLYRGRTKKKKNCRQLRFFEVTPN